MSHSDNRALFFNLQIERFRRASLLPKNYKVHLCTQQQHMLYILRIQFYMFIIAQNTILRFHGYQIFLYITFSINNNQRLQIIHSVLVIFSFHTQHYYSPNLQCNLMLFTPAILSFTELVTFYINIWKAVQLITDFEWLSF